jgi:hypothetical protein
VGAHHKREIGARRRQNGEKHKVDEINNEADKDLCLYQADSAVNEHLVKLNVWTRLEV